MIHLPDVTFSTATRVTGAPPENGVNVTVIAIRAAFPAEPVTSQTPFLPLDKTLGPKIENWSELVSGCVGSTLIHPEYSSLSVSYVFAFKATLYLW